MKKFIIASQIALLPLVLFGICNPIMFLINGSQKNINEGVVLLYIFLLAASITIVFMTLIRISPYVSKIDRMEEAEKELYEEKQKLSSAVNHYHLLITEYNEKHIKQ